MEAMYGIETRYTYVCMEYVTYLAREIHFKQNLYFNIFTQENLTGYDLYMDMQKIII